MKYMLLLLLIICINGNVQAQYYEKSAGIRLGETSGIFYKVFKTESIANELMACSRNGGFQIMYLYEKYVPTKLNRNLFIFYGYGGQVGTENARWRRFNIDGPFDTSFNNGFVLSKQNFTMGINGIAGVEYRFNAPVTIGLDVKPRLSLISMRYLQFGFFDVSLSFSFLI